MTNQLVQHTQRPAVAIIGGGLAGLTAAYDLAPHATVTLFEAGEQLGGLAAGFRGRLEWAWPLEHFYHHLFTNDDAILGLTEELGLSQLLEIHRPVTTMFYKGENYPFDTPLRLLQFPHLKMVEKLRMGAALGFLRYHPKPPWRDFDRKLADRWLARWMGRNGYEALWQPMLQGKFGRHYDRVNLAWFWARIYKRTPQLGYYQGGFHAFVDGLASAVEARGVAIELQCPVRAISTHDAGEQSGLTLTTGANGGATQQHFNAALVTTGPHLFQQIAPSLPAAYREKLITLESMGAVVLTIALDRQFLTDGTYWINVPKPEGLPFLALVEHTNMIDASHYGGDHLLYLGNYLDPNHPHFGMSADEVLAEFLPHLTRFNPDFDPSWVRGAWIHKAKYAQPVPTVGYAEHIPDLRTGVPGLYFASMSQVYPWDRGTNYAVEMGRRAAKVVLEDAKPVLDARG